MNNDKKQLIVFLLLTLGFSAGLWIPGFIFKKQFLPGLPVSSLMAFTPAVSVAVIRIVFRRSFCYAAVLENWKILLIPEWKTWITVAMFLKPLIFVLSYAVMVLGGTFLPPPTQITPFFLLICLMFIIAAITEETGWSGFLLPLLLKYFNWVPAGIIIGIFHSIWHYIPFIQVGRSLSWILWQTIYLVSSRIILVWLFKRTDGNVFITVLFHSTGNISWQLFPVNGSYYNPAVTGAISLFTALILILADRKNPVIKKISGKSEV